VLEEKTFYRVGGTEEITVDVRVIAATNCDLDEAVKSGKFRDDLFYRLNVINIHIPPLRERREDIPLLAKSFIERLSHELGKEIDDITESGLKLLIDYNWAGNVRELENAVERAMVTCKNKVLTDEDFSFLELNGSRSNPWDVPDSMTLDDIEKRVIEATIRCTQGNVKEAATILGIDRSTLYEKIKKYEIER